MALPAPECHLAHGARATFHLGAVEESGAQADVDPVHDDLVEELAQSVSERIDSRTAEAVEKLWLKGQKAMAQMQKQHAEQTKLLEQQLRMCQEAQKAAAAENKQLQASLNDLLKHIKVFSPWTSHAASMAGGCYAASTHTPKAWSKSSADSGSRSSSMASSAKTVLPAPQEIPTDDMLPSGRPATPVPLEAPPPPPDELGDEPPPGLSDDEASKPPPPPLRYDFTLRRADNVSLGLEVEGESGDNFLKVRKVHLGGAVDAWNRQCAGEIQEVKVGDRIVKINQAEEADEMLDQCRTKLLLKLSVERDIRLARLRAEADEFIPMAGAH